MIAEPLAALAGLAALRALAHRGILHGLRAPRLPHPPAPHDPSWPASAVRELFIPGPRGRRLFARLVMPATPGVAATPDPGHAAGAPAVLVMHGWGANAGMMWPVVPPLHAAGFAVLLLDARCHGRSDADDFSSMPRFAEDITAGLAWLRLQPGIAPGRIALLGHSVGAAAALLHAATQADVRAVVSLAAFAHPREVMRRLLAQWHLPYPLLGWYVLRHVQQVIGTSFDTIAPLATLPRLRCPVLLVHGRGDTTVPFGDALRLQAVARGAELLALDADHDLRDALAPQAETLLQFLAAACAPARSSY